MRKIRAKLTYSNVISTLCLFLILGGGAYAAARLPKNSVGPRQIKPNAVSGTKVKNGSLTGADINASTLGQVPDAAHAAHSDSAGEASHATSAENATHAGNADSLGGAVPSDFGAVLSGRINGLNNTSNGIDFGSPSGASTAVASEDGVKMLSPNRDLTARDFSVRLLAGTGGGTRTFELVVNGSTAAALTCGPINGPDSTPFTCNSGSDTEAIPANSTLSIRDSNSIFPSGHDDAMFALRLTP